VAKTLTVKQKRWLLYAHILFTVAWLGTVFGFLVLSVTAAITRDGDTLQGVYIAMRLLDLTVVQVSAIGTIITGVLRGVLTQWGLTKFYWIIVKEILSVFSIALGIFAMHNLIIESVSITSAQGLDALHDPTYTVNRSVILAGIVLEIVSLSVMVLLSVFKPWGKRKENTHKPGKRTDKLEEKVGREPAA